MTPEAFKALRERVGTRATCALLLDVTPQTLSLMERGGSPVQKAYVLALRYLHNQAATGSRPGKRKGNGAGAYREALASSRTVTEAARKLGVCRRSVYDVAEAHGMPLPPKP